MNSVRRLQFLLMSLPILVRFFRLVIVAAGEGHSERMPFVSLRRIEEFARFLAAHLTGRALAIRCLRIVRGRLRAGGARLLRARRLAGCGSGWRLTGVTRRLIAF
jgi:hypothetical protein